MLLAGSADKESETMRITLGMMTDTALANIERNQQRTSDLQNQITSGSPYLFAGTRSDKPGYVQAAPSATTPAAYQGNQRAIQREISPSVSISVNVDAQAAFDPTFAALQTLANGLSNNDIPTIQGSL